MGDNGKPVPVSPKEYIKFGVQPLFGEDEWKRPTKKDMLGYKNYIN